MSSPPVLPKTDPAANASPRIPIFCATGYARRLPAKKNHATAAVKT